MNAEISSVFVGWIWLGAEAVAALTAVLVAGCALCGLCERGEMERMPASAERNEAAEEARMAYQSGEDVEGSPVEQLARGIVPLALRQR